MQGGGQIRGKKRRAEKEGKKNPDVYYSIWASVAEISTYLFPYRSYGDNDLALGTAECTT